MKNLKSLPTIFCIALALTCFYVSATAQSADDKNRFAAISGGGSSVRWDVGTQHAGLTMTVSAPDGQVFRKEFKPGASPEFPLIDKQGNRLADGQYTYELRLTPVLSNSVRKELAASRNKTNDDDALVEREMRKRGQLPSQPLVQSGTFTILNGSVVVSGAVEPGAQRPSARMDRQPRALSLARPFVQAEAFVMQEATFVPARSVGATLQPSAHAALPDQVIPDDLIVQGSACVGLDCVNNESFGFDTIRLKENNTRIKFDDTSTSAGFPANDWQLTANDSASGGASKFSIEDITGSKVPFTITAGAATNSIFVDSTGRLGLRTSTPVLDIHTNTGNTPAIRLEQNNSGGFTAQTWDIGANEANFFVRDVTGGSLLSFRIRPGAPTSSLDISASGNVGVGTASPLSKLHVVGKLIGEGSGSGNNAFVDFGRLNTVGSGEVGFQLGRSGTTSGVAVIQGAKEGAGPNNITMQRDGGNVGIGTVTPSERLEVSGNIRVTGGSFIDDGTTLNVPDYVFEEDYRLMTLDDLRAYIASRKHLPNMPSASDVRQKGLNLSQYQMKLLEKIEELTLHVLSEQEQRKAQQKEIEQLKAQIRQLQSGASTGHRTRSRRR